MGISKKLDVEEILKARVEGGRGPWEPVHWQMQQDVPFYDHVL